MMKVLVALIPAVALMVSCGGAMDTDELTIPEGTEVGQLTSAACTTYNSTIAAARNWIASNCGAITGCGSADSSSHADLQISGGTSAMCTCYGKMWAVRNGSVFGTLQVIYHPAASCSSWPHIHLQSGKNTCGIMHFDVDNSSNDCYNQDTGSKIDEAFCYSGSRKSGC